MIVPSIMTRTQILLGFAVVGLLLAYVLWWTSERSSPGSTVASRESGVTHEPTMLALDVPDPSLAQATQDSSEAAERRPASGSPRPLVLSGVVLDFEVGSQGPGSAASGVSVGCMESSDQGEIGFLNGERPPEVLTDASGRFRIELPDPGKRPIGFELWAAGNDLFREGVAKVSLAEAEREATEIVLKRYAKGELVGVTQDVEGKPVPDVRLAFIGGAKQEEVISDAQGHFHIANAEWAQNLTATREGYALVEARKPVARREGGWEIMRVVLAASGGMRVLVLDSHGQPLPRASIVLGVSGLEAFGKKRGDFVTHFRTQLEATSDASGTVIFDRVWAGQRLRVELRPSPAWRSRALSGERAKDGTILFDESIEGHSIAVEPGEELSLRAVAPATYRIEGEVQDDAGKPILDASITLNLIDQEPDASSASSEFQSYEDSHFSFEIPAPAPSCRARLFATTTGGFMNPSDDTRAVVREFILEVGTPIETVLVLEKTQSIRGRVIDRDGNGVRGWVVARLSKQGSTPLRQRIAQAAPSGDFALNGLLPGRYDLLVRPNERYAEHWVEGVDTGHDGLEIRVEQDRPVRLVVDVRTRGIEAGEIIFLQGRLEPREGAFPDAPLLSSSSERNALEGWPGAAVGAGYGSSGSNEAQGAVTYNSGPMRENPKTVLLNEGFYWFGAKGKDVKGRKLFPIGTGLVRVTAGEYRLRLELVPAIPIKGRVHAKGSRDMAVALARTDGQLLEFDLGGTRMQAVRELGADGSFTFPTVPIGGVELRVGTAGELLAGKARHRQALTVIGDDDPFLDVVIR